MTLPQPRSGRLGALLGVAHARWRLSGADLVAFSRELEESGVESVWIYEDFFEGEGVAQAAAILTHTEHVLVGIAVTNPWVRHPALLAMSAAQLSRLGPGRFRLGLGRSLPHWMRSIGRPSRPIEHVGECVEVVRKLLHGETVSGRAAGWILDGVQLTEAPPRPPGIYVSAMGPKMLKAAGTVADGVLFDNFVTPAWVETAIGIANAAADAAGRPRPHVAAQVVVATPTEGAEVKEWMRSQLRVPGWEKTRLMWGAPPGASSSNLPDDLVKQAAAIGSPEVMVERLHSFIQAGASEIFLSTCTRGDELPAARQILAVLGSSPGSSPV